MYIKFDHSQDSIVFAMGITPNVMEEVDKTLASLPATDKTSVLLEKAIHIFRNDDVAIAYMLIKLGQHLGQIISKIEKSNPSVEESKVFDIHTGEVPE